MSEQRLLGRRMLHITMEAVNEEEIFRRVVRELRRNSMSVVSGAYSVGNGGRILKWLMVVDISKFKGNLCEALDSLRRIPGVSRVHCEPLLRGVVVGEGMVLSSLLRAVSSRWGDAGKVFMYYTGIDIGVQMAKRIMELLGVREPVEVLEAGLEELKTLGWVSGYEVKVESGHIQVSLEGLFECMHVGEGGGIQTSPLTRGMLAGLVEASAGRRPTVYETACVRLGADRCKFVITP